MIIINLTGGLGNQMFQYAFGKTIAERNNTNLKYHYTTALFNTKRAFELDVYNISTSSTPDSDLKRFRIIQNPKINRVFYLLDERFSIQFNKHIVTQKFPYTYNQNYLTINDNTYIQGFWNDERYFTEIADIIKKEFTTKTKLDKKNQEILSKIKKTNSVSVHIRRGDYVTNKNNAGFVGTDYYVKAFMRLNMQLKNPVYYIFSDDIPWCKINLSGYSNNINFIDNNKGKDSHKDIFLMGACKHNIIANSTFSWWGAWLNQNKEKIVIKP